MAAADDDDAALARWIRAALDAERPRVPSLIVTVWGDAIEPVRDEVWLATLFALAAPFGANARAVRTGVFRLARARWLESRPVGRRSRYRLTAQGREGFERAFHRVYDPPFRAWNGRWEGLVADPASTTPAERARLRDELAWAGFGRFGTDLWLRPAREGDDATPIVRALGLERAVTAFEARDRDGPLRSLRERSEDVWALRTLDAEYRRFLAHYQALLRTWAGLRPAPEQAFVVRSLLVHDYRRVRLRDPQLPREVLGREWPAERAYRTARALYRATSPGARAFVQEVFADAGEPAPARRGRPATRF